MNRREFLKATALASLSSVTPLNLWAANTSEAVNKKLLVILLRGAVDGLNVVIPAGDRRYYELRPTIAIKPGAALNLDGYFALHPALAPMISLWKSKNLAFVHACGSPDPTRSHFDAQDFMESGEPGVRSAQTGWLDRLLLSLPDNHSAVRAINFGPTIPRIFSGCNRVANVTITGNGRNNSPMALREVPQLIANLYSDDPMLSATFREGVSARQTISKDMAGEAPPSRTEMELANRGASAPTPGFGRQLARFLLKEPTMQVAFVTFGGWDTHVSQGSDTGQLADKLAVLGAGLTELYQSLGDMQDNVTTVVMSEFGRTAHENGNRGTDHGHGNVMWLIGGRINGGKVYGQWNGLANSALYEGRDLPVTTDFRSVLSAVLHGHMNVATTASIFPGFTPDRQLENVLKV
ncbi:MAG: DUF1501 domain-containing protein [Candidatus Obscuribacterales bacterium]|nr:DUF1501 domain-containing protein [Candidatus Obscuribacterales bacterium]